MIRKALFGLALLLGKKAVAVAARRIAEKMLKRPPGR